MLTHEVQLQGHVFLKKFFGFVLKLSNRVCTGFGKFRKVMDLMLPFSRTSEILEKRVCFKMAIEKS